MGEQWARILELSGENLYLPLFGLILVVGARTGHLKQLRNGLFVHTARPAAGSFFETDIKLPNINCDNCTLQVLQFMEEHGLNKEGEFSYHHCADLKITANPALPIDKAWPGQGS